MIPIVASAGADAGAAVQHDIQHYMRPGTLQLAALPPLSLYVHLPWCLKKCPYCDFNSHEQPAGPLPERRYIDAVVADLANPAASFPAFAKLIQIRTSANFHAAKKCKERLTMVWWSRQNS